MARVLIRLLIAGVFLWAAVGKLAAGISGGEPNTVYEQWNRTYPRHYTIVLCEALLGVWLLSGRWKRGAAVTVVVFVSAFSGLIITELGRDRPKPCGCLGAEFVAPHDPVAVRRSLALSLVVNGLIVSGAPWLYYGGDRSPKSGLQC